MRQKLLSLLLILSAFQAMAQDTLSKNHLSIGLVNGAIRNRPELVQGEKRFAAALGIFHGLNFQYTRNFSDHFSLSGIAGFGFLPLTYKISDKDSLPGTAGYGYFNRIHYQVFSNLALQAAYRNQFSKKYAYRVHFGAGIRNLPISYVKIVGSTQNSTNYSIDMQFLNGIKPYAALGGGVIRQIRNLDEISLSLTYEQSFSDVYRGSYALNGGSAGTFACTGSNFNLAFGYTLTGNGKKRAMKRLVESGIDRKTTQKLYRKEIRYIDPRSTFISAYGGLGFGTNKVADAGDFLRHGTVGSFVPRVTVEKGIARNYFAEAGFNIFSYWATLETPVLMSSSLVFDSYQLSIGGGKRIITKNNYNIINLHAGLTFGATNLKKGLAGSGATYYSYYDTVAQQQNTFYATTEDHAQKTFITSAYIGASKDFRLVRNFYLSLSYHFNQGFYPIYEQRVNYYVNSDPIAEAKVTINGSSHVWQAGFKLKVGPKTRKSTAEKLPD